MSQVQTGVPPPKHGQAAPDRMLCLGEKTCVGQDICGEPDTVPWEGSFVAPCRALGGSIPAAAHQMDGAAFLSLHSQGASKPGIPLLNYRVPQVGRDL